MAGTSPRRSVRARTSQPNGGSHHSSSSSNSSGRIERNTRTSHKIESPRKSTPSVSLSSEPLEDSIAPTIEDNSSIRRPKRGLIDDNDKTSSKSDLADIVKSADELVEDDEAVRCICGNDEYIPIPVGDEDPKKSVKASSEIDGVDPDYSDESAGFFVQCDTCKVWQHGLCVGIKSEQESPEEYFCESCRKDLHQIFTASNGQKYSHYLPLYPTISRTTSRAASFSKDGTKSPKIGKNGRAVASLQSTKRRSTMNSRDAAYKEEEELRRAIEASKIEMTVEGNDSGLRRGKRGRSESEEKNEASKRQRTVSGSPSPMNDQPRFGAQVDSDDAILNGRTSGSKKIRGAAARNHREKEAREERDRNRLQAANKRANRAERRRIDDSEPPEEPLPARNPSKALLELEPLPSEPPQSSQPPDTPPAEKAPPSSSHKKGGRPPQGRKGKLGKNQYTRDKDDGGGGDDASPGRSESRDATRPDENGHSSSRGGVGGNHEGKYAKSKGSGGSKVTMPDMKRKVAAMLDFISRTQLEVAQESGATPTGTGMAMGNTENLMRGLAGSILPLLEAKEGAKEASKEGSSNSTDGKGAEEGEKTPLKKFEELSLLEMMDELTRRLVRWQNQFLL